MPVYEGRLVPPPLRLRDALAAVRALDRTDLSRDEVAATFLPTGSSSLVVLTPADGPMRVLVAGPRTRAKYRLIVPAPAFVQLTLAPGAAKALLGVPVHELADRTVSIEDLWGLAGRQLVDAVAPVEGRSTAVVAVLEATLLQRLRARRSTGTGALVQRATRTIERGAGSPTGIGALASRLGVSARTLRDAFRDHVGLSPKRFARIARIRRVVERAGECGLAQLAVEHGFYDQAHLSAEFQALLGVSPGAFRAGRVPLEGRER